KDRLHSVPLVRRPAPRRAHRLGGSTQMKRRWLVPLGALAALAFPATAAAHAGGPAVFTLANQTSGNRVLVFARGHDGTLASAGQARTGGAGEGGHDTLVRESRIEQTRHGSHGE